MHPTAEGPAVTGMVSLPCGSVEMRDDRRGRRWRAEIAPFLLGRFPVTVDLHRELVGVEPESGRSGGGAGTGGGVPVTNVSWFDAVELCNLMSAAAGLAPYYARDPASGEVTREAASGGYRLPTEAEWQYACKAGTGGYRYGEIGSVAWYADNSGDRAHDVGGKEPNPWGLYDMLGNVWEWCWDLYDPEVYGAYRLFRGGGWAEPERGCGATVRRRSHPTFAIDDLGLRFARDAP